MEEDDSRINGEAIEDEIQEELIREWVLATLPSQTACPWCDVMMSMASYRLWSNKHSEASVELRSCGSCAYWHILGKAHQDWAIASASWDAYASVLRVFDTSLPSAVDGELAVALRRHPALYLGVDPTRLERLVASVWRANHGPCEASHIGRSGDGGVDVIYVNSEQEQVLMQVKRRSREDAAEGVDTIRIRSLLGSMVLRSARHGVVVSTADHFSAAALRASDEAAARGMTVELADRHVLDAMLEPLLPERPWFPKAEALSQGLGHELARRLHIPTAEEISTGLPPRPVRLALGDTASLAYKKAYQEAHASDDDDGDEDE